MHHLHAAPDADVCTRQSPMYIHHTCSIPGRKGGREAAPPPPACCIACWAALDAAARGYVTLMCIGSLATALDANGGCLLHARGSATHRWMSERCCARTLRRATRPGLRPQYSASQLAVRTKQTPIVPDGRRRNPRWRRRGGGYGQARPLSTAGEPSGRLGKEGAGLHSFETGFGRLHAWALLSVASDPLACCSLSWC